MFAPKEGPQTQAAEVTIGLSRHAGIGHAPLTGPADAGKSTLCLVAGGLAPRVVGGTLVGTVHLDGEPVGDWPMHRLATHVVSGLQDPAGQLSLIADSVFGEIAFGPANLGVPREALIERVSRALELTGITELAGRDPTQLSGGQQQLVVLAGLLAMEPRVLLLDEPVAHLDAVGSRLVLDAVRAIADDGTAVLLVEQRTEALAAICESVAIIAHGNIVAHGPARTVLDDESVTALGVTELPEARLRRRAREAGIDPARLEVDP